MSLQSTIKRRKELIISRFKAQGFPDSTLKVLNSELEHWEKDIQESAKELKTRVLKNKMFIPATQLYMLKHIDEVLGFKDFKIQRKREPTIRKRYFR